MTNWDKVKEMMDIEEFEESNPFCSAIHKLRQENDCSSRFCITCKKWLEQKYKPQILTESEREYLSAVIKPWRDDAQIIKKMETTCRPEELETYIPKEYIVIITKELDNAVLPCFEKGKWYKGMETTDGYTLEELDL